jgi:hypothetical protein
MRGLWARRSGSCEVQKRTVRAQQGLLAAARCTSQILLKWRVLRVSAIG